MRKVDRIGIQFTQACVDKFS